MKAHNPQRSHMCTNTGPPGNVETGSIVVEAIRRLQVRIQLTAQTTLQ